MADEDCRARLEQMFCAHADQVYAFARHRVDPDTARDVVAETYLAAWRRIEDVPDPPLAWLLATARKVVANQVRGQQRRAALTELVSARPASAEGADELAAQRAEALAAMRSLSASDRDLLMVSAWYGLTPLQAAKVVGCSPATYAVRLSRARRRLRSALSQGRSDPAREECLE